VDVWDGEMRRLHVSRRDNCPTCVGHEFPYLAATVTSRSATLCGRDAIQITLHGAQCLDLPALAGRLRALGEVTCNPFMLRAQVDGYELNLFADARAIIKGTTDETVARTLYSRYVGI
jgi:molybdopterin-synthase adenylyltransferase